ncbi:MAG: hypothetical protein HYX48_03075 [Chlamydiales bacterium]|nr:hypothetical protein [Chlamydiales bacterium]
MKERRKKKGLVFLLFTLLLVSVFLFRSPLLRFALSFVLPPHLSYERLEWKEGKISVKGVHLEDEGMQLHIDEAELTFRPALKPLYLEAQLILSHPEIYLSSEEQSNAALPLHLLVPSRFAGMKLQVRNGVLNLDNSQRFYFTFDSKEAKEEIGHLALTSDPALFHLPLLQIDMKMEEEGPSARLKADEITAPHLFQLVGVFYPPLLNGWKSSAGNIELNAHATLSHEFSLSSFNADVSGHCFTLFHPKLGIEVQGEALRGNCSLPLLSEGRGDLWKELSLSLTLEGAECSYIPAEGGRTPVLGKAEAALVLEPEKEPAFFVSSLLFSGEKKLALRMEGSGKIEERGAFWTTLDMTLGEANALPATARLALSSQKEGDYLLQTEFKEVGPELFSLVSPWTPFSLKEGLLDGKATVEVKEGELALLGFQDVSLRKLSFELPEQKYSGKIDLLELAGEAVKSEAGWNFNQLLIQGFQGDVEAEKIALQADEFELAWDKQGAQRLSLKGLFQGVGSDIEIHRAADLPASGYALVGTATLQEQSTVEFGFRVKGPTFSSFEELLSHFDPQEGWLRSSTLTADVYRDLVHTFDPQIDITGGVSLSATFNEKKLDCTVEGSELAADHPLFNFSLSGTHQAHLAYTFESEELEGEMPLISGRYVDKATSLVIEKISGMCTLSKEQISLNGVKAECGKVLFQGELHLTETQPKTFDLIVASTSLSGEASDFWRLLQHFKGFPTAGLPLKGQIVTPAEGFTLYARLGAGQEPAAWRFTGDLVQGEVQLSPSAQLKNLSCGLTADSHAKLFSLKEGRGVFALSDGSTYNFDLPQAAFKLEGEIRGEFDLRLLQEKLELIRLAGSVKGVAKKGAKDEIAVRFDPIRSHYFQTKPRDATLSLSESGKLLLLNCDLAVAGREIFQQCEFLKRVGLVAFDPPQISSTSDIDLRLRYNGFLAFEAEGRDLSFKGKSYAQFAMKGEKRGAEWNIKKLSVGGINLQTTLLFEPQRVIIKSFDLVHPLSRMHGEGIYEQVKDRLSCNIQGYQIDFANFSSEQQQSAPAAIKGRGRFEVDLSTMEMTGEAALDIIAEATTFKSEKQIPFTYSPKKGVEVKKVELISAHQETCVTVEKISLDPAMKSGSIKKATHSSAKPLLGANNWEARDLSFVRGEEIWQIGGFSKYEQKPLFLQLAIDFSKEKLVCIQIKDDPKSEGVKLLGRAAGKNGWLWQSARGKFSGVELDLESAPSAGKGQQLSGSIKVDLKQLSSLLPKESREAVALLKLGKGYELIGDLILPKEGSPHFRGALAGQNFECMGYTLNGLRARAEMSMERVVISQLTLADPGAKMQVKLARAEKRPSTGEWHLDVPLIQVQDLRPSLVRRGSEPLGEPKPLTIKHLTLSNIRGEIGVASSFHGSGSLDFTNAFKKESSLLDMPIQFVKDLGLDPGMLVPVYGEIDLDLREGRFFIERLKEAHSDGSRSEFYLAEETPSYIDLKGNVHVDIKMKQNVAFKLVEPFTLKVRGTLEKPKYGI